MVRHGTLRKRRSGRKVTRKAPKHSALKIKSSVTDLFLKQNWDTSKSPKDNLLAMGLNPNPNQSLNAADLDTTNSMNPEKTAFMGFMSLPTGNFEEKNPFRKVLSRSDQEYLVLLLNKHGLNFKKMSHDLVLNHLQHTQQKLEKMYEKYQSLTAEQRRHTTALLLPSSS
jgi:hypothetical protein